MVPSKEAQAQTLDIPQRKVKVEEEEIDHQKERVKVARKEHVPRNPKLHTKDRNAPEAEAHQKAKAKDGAQLIGPAAKGEEKAKVNLEANPHPRDTEKVQVRNHAHSMPRVFVFTATNVGTVMKTQQHLRTLPPPTQNLNLRRTRVNPKEGHLLQAVVLSLLPLRLLLLVLLRLKVLFSP